MRKAIRVVELSDKICVTEVLEAARKYILRQQFRKFRTYYMCEDRIVRRKLLEIRFSGCVKVYGIATAPGENGIFKLSSDIDSHNWNHIRPISKHKLNRTNHINLTASNWNNFIFVKKGSDRGLVYDPVNDKTSMIEGTFCSHRNCTFTVNSTSIVCSGYPCRSIGLFDISSMKWSQENLNLSPNISTCFTWHGKTHILMQNGDFFDFFKRNRQNEVKKLRSFPWPFKTYKQFELLKISEIEKADDKLPYNVKKLKDKVTYKQSQLIHFLLTVRDKRPHEDQSWFSLMMTLNVEKEQLTEFILFDRKRFHDIRFHNSEKLPSFKRIPLIRSPVLIGKCLIGLSKSRIERSVNGIQIKTLQDEYGRFKVNNIGIYSDFAKP